MRPPHQATLLFPQVLGLCWVFAGFLPGLNPATETQQETQQREASGPREIGSKKGVFSRPNRGWEPLRLLNAPVPRGTANHQRRWLLTVHKLSVSCVDNRPGVRLYMHQRPSIERCKDYVMIDNSLMRDAVAVHTGGCGGTCQDLRDARDASRCTLQTLVC